MTDVILPRGRAVALRGTSRTAGVEPLVMHYLSKLASPHKDLYQFGVLTGNGLKKLVHGVCENAPCGHVWGFDSFQGIPEDSVTHTKRSALLPAPISSSVALLSVGIRH